MARSPRSNPSAWELTVELIGSERWFFAAKARRDLAARPIRFDAFAAEVLARPTVYRRRVALVLAEFAALPGMETTGQIDDERVCLWLKAQHERRERYCTVILGLLEVMEAITTYAVFRGYLGVSPFEGDPPQRWFPYRTFRPRRTYTHGAPAPSPGRRAAGDGCRDPLGRLGPRDVPGPCPGRWAPGRLREGQGPPVQERPEAVRGP